MRHHHTKTKGDCAVAKVIMNLTCRGYDIFTPLITEHLPFDLIAYKNGKSYRIQVKYSKKGYLRKDSYNENDFDYYGLYLPDVDTVVFPSINFKGCKIRSIVPNCNNSFYWWEDFKKFTKVTNKRTLKDFSQELVRRKGIANLKKRIVDRPSLKELLRLLRKYNYSKVGRRYKVSDNAVRKWVKFYGYDPKTLERIAIP